MLRLALLSIAGFEYVVVVIFADEIFWKLRMSLTQTEPKIYFFIFIIFLLFYGST